MSFRDKFASKDKAEPTKVKTTPKKPEPRPATIAVEPKVEDGVRKIVPVKVPAPKTKRKPRKSKAETKILNAESLLKNITKVIQKELSESKVMLDELREENLSVKTQLNKFLYNEKNLVLAIWRRVSVKQEWRRGRKPQGIKADNLMPRFGEQVTRDQIQMDLRGLKEAGMLRQNSNGWYNFTKKGEELVSQILNQTEASN